MSLQKMIKCMVGLVVVIILTAWLPFFDSLPWNIPAYGKRAVVAECIRELATHPPVTRAYYVENLRDRESLNPAYEALRRLKAVYPSPLRMIFSQMRWHPETRAWGLIAVSECFPNNTLQIQYAPPLKPLIKWLKDPDPVVASNALAALQTYVVLPPDYFAPGGYGHQLQLLQPADWHAVYDHWLRKEEPSWSQVHTHYYCQRNWPPPIQ